MKYDCQDHLGTFKLLCCCGEGSYGRVFLARSIVTGKIFALKIIAASGENADKELQGVIRYQQVCPQSDLMQIYYAGKEDDCFYYVMDAADNLNDDLPDYKPDTLQNRLDLSGRIPPESLREIAETLLSSLLLLHRKGLMHRDIKPGNILFINGRALPGDIGLAAGDSGNTLVGSSGFISPEVVAGVRKFVPADDYYALGKTLYCALTGNPPEKYPAFPADLSLKECKDIVALYCRLTLL